MAKATFSGSGSTCRMVVATGWDGPSKGCALSAHWPSHHESLRDHVTSWAVSSRYRSSE